MGMLFVVMNKVVGKVRSSIHYFFLLNRFFFFLVKYLRLVREDREPSLPLLCSIKRLFLSRRR